MFTIDTSKSKKPVKKDKYVLQNLWKGPVWAKRKAIKEVLSEPSEKLIINYLSQKVGIIRSIKFLSQVHNWWTLIHILNKHRAAGIFVMDYPSKRIVDKIISTNF